MRNALVFVALVGGIAATCSVHGVDRPNIILCMADDMGYGQEQSKPALDSAKPNVILVMTDDQGYGDLGCHGNDILQTPHLDRLYQQSVRMTDFHVSPFCTPTRAALMTGQNPLRVGAWATTWGRSLVRRNAGTMAEMFADGGYRTGCFGKWHLGDNYPYRPQDRGFQEVLVHGGGGVGQAPDYWGNDYSDDTYFRSGKPEKQQGYCTDVWFDEAWKFITAKKDQPFFAYISTNAPHSPFIVAEEYSKPYEEDKRSVVPAFNGMITNIDENMGRLMKRLEESGLAKNTILIFMTDNGTAGGCTSEANDPKKKARGFNAGMRGRKGSYFDGGHRVPFFIRWPAGGLTEGRDITALTAHIDVIPTLAELCGLQLPENVGPDGISFAPLLRKQTTEWPERKVFVQHHMHWTTPRKGNAAVLTRRWRLLHHQLLYDIKADPGQATNVAGQYPEVVEQLRKAHDAWWQDVSKRFDEFNHIVLGDNARNPAALSSLDWHGPSVWSQHGVSKGNMKNGFWAVEIAKPGTYNITLRRWPKEIDQPINAPIPGGKAIPPGEAITATRARLTIADKDLSLPVDKDDTGVTFTVELKAGKTQMQTWLIDEKTGQSRGAYYVDVYRQCPSANRDAHAQKEPKPNVILVMTDDQGYPDMSCHGNPVLDTPNIDKLAQTSVRFSDFHVNPFCSPTRAALMTGRMSDRTGVTSTNFQRNYLRRDEVLMPEYFKASGYRTGHFGKWHIGANYPYRPMDRGFDQWLGLGNNGLATTADLWDNDRMNDTYWHNGQLTRRPGFCADVYFDETMAFIRKCKQDRIPFFAYLATNVPHWDWNVPSEWLKPHEGQSSRKKAAFFASISRVDWNLGRLIRFLEKEQLLNDSILVFLTDNGSDVPDKNQAFKAGMRGFKGSLYEGGHRVPCFIHAPQSLVGKPRIIDELTAHVDLLPTFIDLCRLKQPQRKQLPMDGRSLRPLLTGSGPWPDRMLVMHHQNGWQPQKHANSVVLTSQWRMIRRWSPKTRTTGAAELYRIQEDRGQAKDVAARHPDVVRELESAYSDHWDALRLDRPLERPILSKHATLRLSTDITRDGGFITQQAVRKGQRLQPLWAIEVKAPGRFRFEVRRWPREVSVPMTAGLPPADDPEIEYIGHDSWKIDVPGTALDIAEVQLELSNRPSLTKKVPAGAQGVAFDVDLEAGPLDLQAWLIEPNGQRMGAYYVYAEQLQ